MMSCSFVPLSDLRDANLTHWSEAATPTAIQGATDPSPGWAVPEGKAKGFYVVVGALGKHSTTEKPTGAASLWRAGGNFSDFEAVGHDLFEFPWGRCFNRG